MPYKIRKLPKTNKYRVYIDHGDKRGKQIIAKATTLKKAKAQIRLLSAIKHNPSFRLRSQLKGGEAIKMNPSVNPNENEEAFQSISVKEEKEHEKNIRQTLEPTFQPNKKKSGLSNVLKMVCKDPVRCIGLGKYNDYLKEYFGQFKDLSLVDTLAIKRIGSLSANGFVLRLPFKRPESNFTAYTVIKCSANTHSDNLFYEYYVGKEFINKISTKLPNFLETYDVYRFKTSDDWNTARNFANQQFPLTPIDLNSMLIHPNIRSFSESCRDNEKFCLLVQYFDKLYSFRSLFETNWNFGEIGYDMFGLMYQVYFALTYLAPNYTHYDLHQENVLLYKPYDGSKQYIEMHYHLKSGRVITFPTEYVCKIIDYGRNYINANAIESSEIIEQICQNNEKCGQDCGVQHGYNMIRGNIMKNLKNNINPENYDAAISYITPNKFNNAHDLRLINSLRKGDFGIKQLSNDEKLSYAEKFKNYPIPEYNNFFDAVCNIVYKDRYGTPDIDNATENFIRSKNGPNDKPDILTIFDAREMLEKNIDSFIEYETSKKYSTWQKAAVMHIYEDGRDYQFDELNTNTKETPSTETFWQQQEEANKKEVEQMRENALQQHLREQQMREENEKQLELKKQQQLAEKNKADEIQKQIQLMKQQRPNPLLQQRQRPRQQIPIAAAAAIEDEPSIFGGTKRRYKNNNKRTQRRLRRHHHRQST